jgi:hypothetical protein
MHVSFIDSYVSFIDLMINFLKNIDEVRQETKKKITFLFMIPHGAVLLLFRVLQLLYW